MEKKHPKHRRIPRTLLKIKAFKAMEDKVIMGVHVLELMVMLFVAIMAVSTAFFLSLNKDSNDFISNPIDQMSDTGAIEQSGSDEKTSDTVNTTESVDTKSTTVDKDKIVKEMIIIDTNDR